MNYYIVTVYDSAADTYSRPIFTQSRGTALRSFTDEVNSESADSPMNKHPYDYSLHAIGQFNDATGEFDTHKPDLIARAIDVIYKKPPQDNIA